jgi:filamentous hemagglutinin family protein
MSRWHLNMAVWLSSAMWALGGVRPIAAQIIPDATLSVGERSQVTGNPTVQIDGGAIRGGNLFHSFSQFSIPTGGSAYFNNAPTIINIFARVTGNSLSNIDGLLRANGTANLFLLNPNGILFGANASLNLGGSFVASTADRWQFDQGFAFSASNPQVPPLLTVNVPIGLQYGSNPGSIQVQGATLRVALGQTLALLGGNVNITGGRLFAPNGRVELGGVAAAESLGLSANGSSLQLSFSNVVERADILIGQQAELNARNNDGGSIAINARNINISGNSRVRAGIAIGLGSPQSQAGDIELNATAAVQVTGGSVIANNTGGQGNAGAVRISAQDFVSFGQASEVQSGIAPGVVGNTGGIVINTGSLYLSGASFNSVNDRGQGNPGNIIINARDAIVLSGSENPEAPLASASNIRSSVQRGEGDGGDIQITTGSMLLKNGSTVFSGVLNAQGNAGSININARDTITIDGGNRLDQVSGIRSNIFEGKSNSGGINLVTGSLLVKNGGILNTNVQSLQGGSAGNININARDTVTFEGVSGGGKPSRGLSNVVSQSGNGGDINITARSLSISNGAQLSASTAGAGNAGNITASADTVGFSDGGQLLTTTSSSGRAGDITVKTPDLQLRGASSGLFADTTSTGDAGNLTIQPQGNGQSVRVNLQDGAQISASTSGSGRGGQLTIAAPESITLTGNGSVIAAGAESSGAGGNLTLRTGTLNIQDRAEVTVSSAGTGNAGTLFVDADRIFLDNQGRIRADTTGGGGNINLRSGLMLLRRGSNITTNATGANVPGGNITIDTQFLVAVPNEDSNISANSEDFRGGNVNINAFSIFGIQPRFSLTPLSDITATGATFALSGTINVFTAGLDPTAGLVELPTAFVDPSRLIAQGCPADRGNSFVISGRGGLPPTPEQQLDDDADWPDRRRLTVAYRPAPSVTPTTRMPPPTDAPIVEATGWQIMPTGEIFLVATPVHAAVQNPSVDCPGGL